MLLKAYNISKSFGATQALDDVSITLEAGQVHALVGENGAGKSTLFKICAGVIPKDTGQMTIDGKPYEPRSMSEAQKAGVALVFQEITINPSLDIAENIFIERMRRYAGPLGLTNWRALQDAAQRILDDMGAEISVKQGLTELDLGQLKILEVARALSYNPKVLLLDESTAFLSTQEMEALFNVINTLKRQGIAIGYISHHLDEVEKIADSITILKDGRWVGNYARGELTNEQIEARMVGREIGHDIYPERRNHRSDEVIFSLENVSIPGKLQEVTLSLCRGEVLGIGGLKGSGGEQILRIINGDMLLRDGGRMTFERQPYQPRTPYDAWHRGIAYLPGDRTGEGLIIDFSVRENLSMAVMPHKGLFVDRPAEKRLVHDMMSQLKIKAQSPEVSCTSLSGGNLQKVVLGKCIAPEPKVLLLNNPTRGIDVGARMQIYGIIRELADKGISIILLSEDLAELVGICDRIIVMRKGKISKVFSHEEIPSEEEIISYMI